MRRSQQLLELAVLGFDLAQPRGLADLQATELDTQVAPLKPLARHSSLTAIPASACLKNPTICSSLNSPSIDVPKKEADMELYAAIDLQMSAGTLSSHAVFAFPAKLLRKTESSAGGAFG